MKPNVSYLDNAGDYSYIFVFDLVGVLFFEIALTKLPVGFLETNLGLLGGSV